MLLHINSFPSLVYEIGRKGGEFLQSALTARDRPPNNQRSQSVFFIWTLTLTL